MTEKEALALLGLEAGPDGIRYGDDELQDALEEQLFELKRFFISRAPIRKLFQSRLDKLEKIHQALEVLAPDFDFSYNLPVVSFPESGNILEVFQAYQQENRRLKTGISQSANPLDIHALAERLLALEKAYAEKWAIEPKGEKTLVSKESDPMEILGAIKAFREKGGKSFEDLKKEENTAPRALINEMKRLSLLFFRY